MPRYAPALDSHGIDLSRLLWIQPPKQDQAFWAAEQLLQSGLLSAVAFWTSQELDGNVERRLQLAAETSRCLALAFRVGAPQGQSYAALKLALAPAADGQGVRPATRRCTLRQQAAEVSPGAVAVRDETLRIKGNGMLRTSKRVGCHRSTDHAWSVSRSRAGAADGVAPPTPPHVAFGRSPHFRPDAGRSSRNRFGPAAIPPWRRGLRGDARRVSGSANHRFVNQGSNS